MKKSLKLISVLKEISEENTNPNRYGKHGIVPNLERYIELSDIDVELDQEDFDELERIEQQAKESGMYDQLVRAAEIHNFGRPNKSTGSNELEDREWWAKNTPNRFNKSGKLNKNVASGLKNRIKRSR